MRFAACLLTVVFCLAVRAEDNAPPVQPPVQPPEPPQQQRPQPPLLGNNPNNANTPPKGQALLPYLSKMLGIDVVGPVDQVKFEALALGTARRFVNQVPVGGIDNPTATGKGWKLESFFQLSDEQANSLHDLRTQYAAEAEKLQKDIAEQQKANIERAKTLRTAYEQKANDLLTGADKDAKQKMDETIKNLDAQKLAAVTDNLPLYDIDDQQQVYAMVRAIRDKVAALTEQAGAALVSAATAFGHDKMAEVIKNDQDAARMAQRAAAWQGGQGGFGGFGGGAPGGGGPNGGGGRRGNRPRNNTDAVPPPAPPDTVPNF